MALYSLNGAIPAELPHRIRIPDGEGGMRTRTDPSSFTVGELVAAGYSGPYIPPAHDPATERLEWDAGNLQYNVVAKTPQEIDATAQELCGDRNRKNFESGQRRRAAQLSADDNAVEALKVRLAILGG